ncbi:MAG: hypothetical protein FD153_452 [Rhodospirillaceae bacterium]|nr:MAG: hypothetical protein FD153_452 [Rhodospirillaceae bacterium]
MQTEDIVMLHELYFVSTGQYRADEGYPLMVYLMPRLLGTGRCVLDPYDRECLHLGPTRPVRLQWILAEDATQRPRLVPGDDTLWMERPADRWQWESTVSCSPRFSKPLR